MPRSSSSISSCRDRQAAAVRIGVAQLGEHGLRVARDQLVQHGPLGCAALVAAERLSGGAGRAFGRGRPRARAGALKVPRRPITTTRRALAARDVRMPDVRQLSSRLRWRLPNSGPPRGRSDNALPRPRRRRKGGVARSDQPRLVAELSVFRSCISCAIERGLAVGAQRARMTFHPFRAFAASLTMVATSAGPRAARRCASSIRTRPPRRDAPRDSSTGDDTRVRLARTRTSRAW